MQTVAHNRDVQAWPQEYPGTAIQTPAVMKWFVLPAAFGRCQSWAGLCQHVWSEHYLGSDQSVACERASSPLFGQAQPDVEQKTHGDSPWAPGMIINPTLARTKELQSLGKWIPCSSWSNLLPVTAAVVPSVPALEGAGDSTRAKLTHFLKKSSIWPKSCLCQRGDSSVPWAVASNLFFLRGSVKYLLFLYQWKILSHPRTSFISEAGLW